MCPPGTFYNHRTQTCVHRYCRIDRTEEKPEIDPDIAQESVTLVSILARGCCPHCSLQDVVQVINATNGARITPP